jgi:aquaporin Z
LPFGLTVLTMARGHFNSAVTIGLWAGGRFRATDVLPYVIAQVVGAIAAPAVLYAIASGKPDWFPSGFASNGYGELSPGKYSLTSCFLIEVIATFFFLYVIIGTTSKGAAVGFAGIPIGLCLTLIHLDFNWLVLWTALLGWPPVVPSARATIELVLSCRAETGRTRGLWT